MSEGRKKEEKEEEIGAHEEEKYIVKVKGVLEVEIVSKKLF